MPWELWRQDEHGNESLIAEFGDRAGAETARDQFIERGHHQHYWVMGPPEIDAGGGASGDAAARTWHDGTTPEP